MDAVIFRSQLPVTKFQVVFSFQIFVEQNAALRRVIKKKTHPTPHKINSHTEILKNKTGTVSI